MLLGYPHGHGLKPPFPCAFFTVRRRYASKRGVRPPGPVGVFDPGHWKQLSGPVDVELSLSGPPVMDIYIYISQLEKHVQHHFISTLILISTLSFFNMFCQHQLPSPADKKPRGSSSVGISRCSTSRWWCGGYVLPKKNPRFNKSADVQCWLVVVYPPLLKNMSSSIGMMKATQY